MGSRRLIVATLAFATTVILTMAVDGRSCRVCAQDFPYILQPEQRYLDVDSRCQLPSYPIPYLDAPPLATDTELQPTDRFLSLDEAIRIALENAEVVRVLGGVTAASSGRTIYDVPSTNTTIDQAMATFDPTIGVNNVFNQNDSPSVVSDPLNPGLAQTVGSQAENYNLDFTFSKTNLWGGTGGVRVNSSPTNFEFGLGRPLLNPNVRSSVEMSLTQPILRGAGRATNQVPIVVARINTERSFFQYKDSVQELVRSVVDAYWSLVFAKTDEWARERQVEQAEFALRYIRARRAEGIDNLADESQAEVALYNFEASLLGSRANVFQREEALRNLLGLPLTDGTRLVPTTPPRREAVPIQWNELVTIAEANRPDIIELKLILEADEQQLIQARNQTLPQLDAVAVYRWNGLEGVLPNNTNFDTDTGQFTDWTLGVNFSIPLGQRAARAGVRQQELNIARDRALLDQGIHSMVYTLAFNYRNSDLLHAQYQRFVQTRDAAAVNLQAQSLRYQNDLDILLNVLQAITNWGNAVSAEAQSLTQYNTQLATLERQTGTILESHGIRFYEERHGFAGPLWTEPLYPSRLLPSENWEQYEPGDRPSHESFDLEIPDTRLPERRIPQLNDPNATIGLPSASLNGAIRFFPNDEHPRPPIRLVGRIEEQPPR